MAATTAMRWLFLVLIVLIGSNAFWMVHSNGLASQRDNARSDRDALRADVATQRAAFEARARQQEREQHQALAGIRVIFDREITDVQTKHDAVVADLRAGTLRLRQHWQAHLATAELSAAVAANIRAGTIDADTELRRSGAADLVRLGAECDTRIRSLQSAIHVYAGGTP